MDKTQRLNEMMLQELIRLNIEPTRQNCLDFLLGYRETLEEAAGALEHDFATYRQYLTVKREATRVKIEIHFQK